jgi:4-amino-4-deoxy-L-arabinose transferase-like glycosyltransferase
VHGKETWWIAALAIVVVAALGIRLVTLGSEPFWLDEACTYEFNAGSFGNVLTAYAKDVHPPLYGVLLHAWQAVVGDSERALRGYSTLWSIIGLLFGVFLTRDITGSRRAALLSGVLLAVNPLDIWYAQEARMYAQAAGLSAIAIWLLWRWLRTGGRGEGHARLAIAYGLVAAMLLYSHYVTAIVLASQLIVVLALFSVARRWRDATWLVSAISAVGVLFIPWVLFVHRFRDSLYSAQLVGWIPKPHVVDVLGYLNHEFFLGFGTAQGGATGWFAIVAGVILGLVVAAAASEGPGPQGESSLSNWETRTFLLGLAIGPPLLAAAVSDLWHPILFRPRFSLFCLIPTVVALVMLLTRIRPPLRTVLAATIAALMATGAVWQAMSPTKQGLPELRRLATAFGDPEFVVLLPPPHGMLVHYYLPSARLQPSAKVLAARLRRDGSTTIWVGFKGGTVPPPGSPDGDLVAWLATTGPYRFLGHADGFAVYELHARPLSRGHGAGIPEATATGHRSE